MIKNQKFLKIGWLYPDLMSTYGDRGNIICLIKRCNWRGIKTELIKINLNTPIKYLINIDLIFGGGAQDKQQEIVIKDLLNNKAKIIKKLISKSIPALFVCGSPQLMGKYYETVNNKKIKGLNIFNMITKNPSKSKKRCIGNITAEVILNNLDRKYINKSKIIIVGFENHGGRTYLQNGTKPLAKVIKGYGNNGYDKTEGVIYKNAIGTYLHGPFLLKNPEIADYLIAKALFVKYGNLNKLLKLNDSLEYKAKQAVLNK